LLGNRDGNTGTIALRVTGVARNAWLEHDGSVQAEVERIPDSLQSPIPGPQVISDKAVAVVKGALSIPINWTGQDDAYVVYLTVPKALLSVPDANPTAAIPAVGVVTNVVNAAAERCMEVAGFSTKAGGSVQ